MANSEDIYSTVDREAKDDAERRESRVLLEVLTARRDQLGGVAQIPAQDQKLSEQILTEAKKRSAQISASRQKSVSQSLQTPTRPIPLWLWVAWIVAVAAVVIAFAYIDP